MAENNHPTRFYHFMGLVSLIMAGEAVFSLPFHIVRFFRPTVLEVFQISNTQIGQVQATYGVIAMAAYFFGGPLADRFQARNLLILALVTTALGGFYFAQIPDQNGLYFLFAFWGCSTILLFWGALIKATREWGGSGQQGVAFGFLEAGRGLFAAVLVTIAIGILRLSVTDDLSELGPNDRRAALQQIIYLYIATTLIAATCVAIFIPSHRREVRENESSGFFRNHLLAVLGNRLIWPQMLIVVSAYVAYKGVDNYVLYAVQGYGLDEVAGATVGATSSWVRPVAAVLAGYLADRYRASRVITACFATLLLGYTVFVLMNPRPDLYWVLITNVAITSAAIYALHAIYFALLAESKVPLSITGTAIGVISVIGFTPDIFVAPAMGWLLDNNSTIIGHQMVFGGLAAFSIVGFLAAIAFIRGMSPAPINRPGTG